MNGKAVFRVLPLAGVAEIVKGSVLPVIGQGSNNFKGGSGGILSCRARFSSGLPESSLIRASQSSSRVLGLNPGLLTSARIRPVEASSTITRPPVVSQRLRSRLLKIYAEGSHQVVPLLFFLSQIALKLFQRISVRLAADPCPGSFPVRFRRTPHTLRCGRKARHRDKLWSHFLPRPPVSEPARFHRKPE